MSLGGYHMKRRVLSSIIALALCLNLFPVGAFAADGGTDGSCAHIIRLIRTRVGMPRQYWNRNVLISTMMAAIQRS